MERNHHTNLEKKRNASQLRAILGIAVLMLAIFVFSSCSIPLFGNSDATPTPNVTQAYQTVYAKLTSAVAQTPEVTVLPSATPSPTSNQVPTAIISTATSTPTLVLDTPSPRCNMAAPGIPIDVTIPDDTQMYPGQAFTKTWRLENIGECTWTKNYSLKFFSGDPMDALQQLPLPQDVPPGTSIDVSVDMIAPQQPGKYQGNWKLMDAGGYEFGIGPNGDSPFWVRIEVLASTVPTFTATPATPSVTPTPGVEASGEVIIIPGDRLDLDTGGVNPESGEDVTYEKVAEGIHQLKAVGATLLGVFGNAKPSYSDCKAANPSATFINVEALTPGTYLCYRTGLGLPGRLLISEFNTLDATLTLEIYTWSVP